MQKDKFNSYIGHGTILKGKLSHGGVIRLDGEFEGELETDSTLIVGMSGKVKANVKTGYLFNYGMVMGDVEASEKILLHKKACIAPLKDVVDQWVDCMPNRYDVFCFSLLSIR